MGRREQKNRATKAAIVANALRLFREQGYDAVTVEAITRAAGVAKGTFYNYFAVKSDIIVEEFWIIDEYYGQYASRNLRRYPSPVDKLRAFTRAQMRYVRDVVGNDTLKLLYANQVLLTGQARVIVDPQRQWYRIIAAIVAAGQESGIFRANATPDELAYALNRSMRSIFLDWCITDGGFDLVREGLRYLDEWLVPALVSGAPGSARTSG